MAKTAAMLPTPAELISHLDRFVRGQDEAKSALATCAYNHYLSLAYECEEPEPLYTRPFGLNHVLLLGPTGSGKTYLVRKLADRLGAPVHFGSAAGLVEAGYVGENQVDGLLRGLLVQAEMDVELAQRGIIFLDEVDKIRRRPGTTRDVSGEGVQNALLTILDGRSVTVRLHHETYEIDTSRVLFICAGAFVQLEEIVRRRIKVPHDPAAADQGDDLLAQVLPGDLRRYGMIPELIGRFAVVAPTHRLTAEDLVGIMRDTEGSVLREQRRLYAAHGIDLVFAPEAIEEIAALAYRGGTGARGLRQITLDVLRNLSRRVPELSTAGITRITITDGVVCGWEEPILERADGQTPRNTSERLRRRALKLFRPVPKPNETADGEDRIPPPRRSGRGGSVQIRTSELKDRLGWSDADPEVRHWWEQFERAHNSDPALIVRTLEEVRNRRATIAKFFHACKLARTDNIQAILHYLDYMLLKEKEEQKAKRF